MNTKLDKGELFYHPDLNNLICCRDEFFNSCYNEDDYNAHLKNDKLFYTVDNSGKFHTTNYKYLNDWKEFIVVASNWGGGGTGHGIFDVYPDAWEVYCSPLENEKALIKFYQKTYCFAYTIEKVTLIKKNYE